MTTALLEEPDAEIEVEKVEERSMADVIEELGSIDPARILMTPLPGTATENDAEKYECELIDGTLVRKDMSFDSNFAGAFLLMHLMQFVMHHKLGAVLGEAGLMRLRPGLVRAPDVSFISNARLKAGSRPKRGVPTLVPDLAVEVLSPGNTKAEMARKRREFFAAGVRLVWELQPQTRTAVVFTADDEGTPLAVDGLLDGGEVLPGFTIPLAQVFGSIDALEIE